MIVTTKKCKECGVNILVKTGVHKAQHKEYLCKNCKPNEKQLQRKIELKTLKQNLKQKALEDGHIICKGCSMVLKPYQIEASHISSIGAMPNQALNEKNITHLCTNCHRKWENGTIQQKVRLHCFEQDMQKLKQLNPNKFYKIMDLLLPFDKKLYDKLCIIQ